MKPYELLLAYRVFNFVGNLKPAEVRLLHRKFQQIRLAPLNNSEQTVFEPEGRAVELSTWHRFCIRYWIDEADREVKILDIYAKD